MTQSGGGAFASAPTPQFSCAADRMLVKGLWIPGTCEVLGEVLQWKASGLEDPQVKAKLEESIEATAAKVSAKDAFLLDVKLEDVTGPPQR